MKQITFKIFIAYSILFFASVNSPLFAQLPHKQPPVVTIPPPPKLPPPPQLPSPPLLPPPAKLPPPPQFDPPQYDPSKGTYYGGYPNGNKTNGSEADNKMCYNLQLLNVYSVTQEHSKWCWAAATVSILNYYGVFVDQCKVVNTAINYKLGSCCGDHIFNAQSTCNVENSLYSKWQLNKNVKEILSQLGNIQSEGLERSLSCEEIQNEINSKRPFIVHWKMFPIEESNKKGGHFVVVVGIADDEIYYYDPYLYFEENPDCNSKDPKTNIRHQNYKWMLFGQDSSCVRQHSWDQTLRMTTNPNTR